MIILLASTALAAEAQLQSVADWEVACQSDAPSNDGLHDRCYLRRSVSGVEVNVTRTAAGAQFTAKIRGCKIKAAIAPEMVTQEQLTGPDANEAFTGGVLRAIVANNRQCPKRGMLLSVGGPEVPSLLAATSKLRPPAP
nr:hypothetical protein [uncultured Sphingosinicella sp.]